MKLTQPIGSEDHVLGRADASMVLVVYGDYECALSARANRVVHQVLAEAPDDMCFVVRHFSLSLIHPRAMLAAQAAEAAAAQGRFWGMHQKLLENQDALEATSPNTLAGSASTSSASRAIFAAASTFTRSSATFVRASRAASTRRPTLFLDGERVDGAWSDNKLLHHVRERRAEAGEQTSSYTCSRQTSISDADAGDAGDRQVRLEGAGLEGSGGLPPRRLGLGLAVPGVGGFPRCSSPRTPSPSVCSPSIPR